MSKNITIIEPGRDDLSAGVFSAATGAPAALVTEHVADDTPLADSVARLLAAIEAEPGVTGPFERVYLSVPVHELSLRVLELPIKDRKKAVDVLPFELSGLLPKDPSEYVIDALPLGGGKVLAAAVEKETLGRYLGALEANGVDPVWAGCAALSVPELLEELYAGPATKAFVTDEVVCVSSEGSPALVSSYDGTEGLALVFAYLRSQGITVDEVYVTHPAPAEIARAAPRGAAVKDLELPGGCPADAAAMYGLYKQIKKGRIKETVNFRRGGFAYTRERARLVRKLRVTAALAVLVMALFCGDLYMRYLTYAREAASYKSALALSYQRLFPGEKAPADELYMLEAKLKALDKEAGVLSADAGVLEVMRAIAGASADKRLIITELKIAAGRVQLRGEAPSFEAANTLKDALSAAPVFKGASLADLKTTTGGTAAFSMTLQTAEGA